MILFLIGLVLVVLWLIRRARRRSTRVVIDPSAPSMRYRIGSTRREVL